VTSPEVTRRPLPPKLPSATPVFLVSDIAATLHWYRTILGFAAEAVPVSPPHNFAILRKDDVVIFLQQLSGYERADVYHRA
jgi:hypothetical protein